jgi:two-component system sensor histidine kinase CiaH
MFGGARWRMVGWSILVLSLIFMAISAVLYASLNHTLMSAVDSQLQSGSESARMELVETGGVSDLQREGYQAGLLYLVIASDGSVVANPQGVDVQAVPRDLLSTRSAAFETVEIAGGAVRLYAQQILEPGGDSVTLVVGQTLAPQEAAARELMLTLLLCGAIGLLLSFAGAWFLAARALVPIQRAFERQQEFVADASHELRTPLTILHSAADLLASEPEQSNPVLVAEIRDEIGRMERLTRDLLTLARSDRGELRLALGRLELGALARDLARRVALLADTRDIKVQVRAGEAPVTVE